MTTNGTNPHLLYSIRFPVLMAMALAMLPLANFNFGLGSGLSGVGLLVVRALIVAAAGYLAVRDAKGGIWRASVAGAMVFFAEQVVVVGLYFVLIGQYAAAGGVVVSFVMFFWVAMIIGVIGGVASMVKFPKVPATHYADTPRQEH